MSYVRKMGASALVVAAAFAVAFAVLVSSTSTQTAEAAPAFLGDTANPTAVTVAPGDTVNVIVPSTFARVTITDTADGVGASFAAGGGQSVACSNANAACDTGDSDSATDGKQNTASEVVVVLNVDADSDEGHILLSVVGIGGTATDATWVITVSKGGLVGSLAIKTDAAADKTIPATAGTSNLTVTVKNASSPAGLLAGQAVQVITTHGTVGCAATAGSAAAGPTQACTATTTADGIVDVLLTGGGVEGTATVTARLGTRTATATVTLFGTAKNLTAAPQQDSVEIGGSVFVVLTVTDGAGNPVAGQVVNPVGSKEVVGPDDDAVKVTTSRDATPDDTADGSGYNVDYIATKAADSIPACGDDKDPVTDAGATPPTTENFTTNGTNAAGKCVVEVNTQKAEGTTKATTRGEHTLNFAIGTLKASATVEVAGAPSSITTDVTGMVDTSSVTKITVSVWDDEDVLVGITDVNIRKVGGDGLIEKAQTATKNGKATFTFIAPSSVGMSEILITAGTVDHRLTLQIGEAPEEPTPPAHVPALNKTPASTGFTAVSFNGGSVADLVAVVTDVCGPSASIYGTSLGEYVGYFVGSPDFVNRAFNDLYADGIDAGEAFLVGGCGS